MSNQAIALQQAAAEDPLNLSLTEEAGKSSDQLLEVIKSVSSVYLVFLFLFYVGPKAFACAKCRTRESFLGCDCVVWEWGGCFQLNGLL